MSMQFKEMSREERELRIEASIKAISSAEGYDKANVVLGALDSIIDEFRVFIEATEGREEVERLHKIGRGILNTLRKEVDDRDAHSVTIKETFIASMLLNTLLGVLDKMSQSSCDGECISCEHCGEIDKERVKALFETGEVSDSDLVLLLSKGDITVNDLQELFGTKVAMDVLALASEELANKAEPKEEGTCTCNNCTCSNKEETKEDTDEEKYAKEFEEIIYLASNAKLSFEDYMERMSRIPLAYQTKFMNDKDIPMPSELRDIIKEISQMNELENLFEDGSKVGVAVVKVKKIKK